jgi:hypothetical protein
LRRAVLDCCSSVAVFLTSIGRFDDGDDTNYFLWHGELDTLLSYPKNIWQSTMGWAGRKI